MNRTIGTTRPYEIPKGIKKYLNLKGDYYFFAIPTPVLEKYGIDSFDIILNENKIMLVALNGTEPPTKNLASTKMETADDKSTT